MGPFSQLSYANATEIRCNATLGVPEKWEKPWKTNGHQPFN